MPRLAFTLALIALLPASVTAQTLDQVENSGVLKLGYREDAAPYSYENAIGEPAGYSIELCQAIAVDIAAALELTELAVDYVPVSTDDRFSAIQDGRIDLLCGATTATLSRRELVDFSLFTFVDGAGVLLRTDSPEDFEGLAGHKVGVRGATTTEQALRRALERLEIEAEIVPVDSHEDGLSKLETNEIAAYFADQAILIFLAAGSDNPENLRLSDRQFTVEPYALALRRGDDEFRLAVDRSLSRLYRSGEVERIFTSTFGASARQTELLRALYIINALPE